MFLSELDLHSKRTQAGRASVNALASRAAWMPLLAASLLTIRWRHIPALHFVTSDMSAREFVLNVEALPR